MTVDHENSHSNDRRLLFAAILLPDAVPLLLHQCHTSLTSIKRRQSAASRAKTTTLLKSSSALFYTFLIASATLIQGVAADAFLSLRGRSGGADASSGLCRVDACGLQFRRRYDGDKVIMGANGRYCSLISDYLRCLNETSRTCRGDIKYHSLFVMLTRQIDQYNCKSMQRPATNVTKGEEYSEESGESAESSFWCENVIGSQPAHYRTCALFGDPHLISFDGAHRFCRSVGAWPLVANAYFAVQVTNLPVPSSGFATAVSKVTVIVKAYRGCTERKTYEASVHDLPSSFTDGTSIVRDSPVARRSTTSMSRQSAAVQIIERVPGEHVELVIRYLSTRISIRKHGSYLSVVVRVPSAVAASTPADTMQLCTAASCPSPPFDALREALAVPRLFSRCRRVDSSAIGRLEALSVCRERRLLGAFLDACVFDLELSGDLRFVDATTDAQNDWQKLTGVIENRTDLTPHGGFRHNFTGECTKKQRRPPSKSTATTLTASGVLFVVSLQLAHLFLFRHRFTIFIS